MPAGYWDEGKYMTFDKKYFIDSIALDLGGRVGEELITNQYSSAAAKDIEDANRTAENVIMRYGLSDLEDEKNKSYITGGYVKDFLLTDKLRNQINTEISKLMKESYERAETLINQNREAFDEIVKRLLEEGILMGDELDEICEKYSKNRIS